MDVCLHVMLCIYSLPWDSSPLKNTGNLTWDSSGVTDVPVFFDTKRVTSFQSFFLFRC